MTEVTGAYLLLLAASSSASEMKLVSFVRYDRHSGTMLHTLWTVHMYHNITQFIIQISLIRWIIQNTAYCLFCTYKLESMFRTAVMMIGAICNCSNHFTPKADNNTLMTSTTELSRVVMCSCRIEKVNIRSKAWRLHRNKTCSTECNIRIAACINYISCISDDREPYKVSYGHRQENTRGMARNRGHQWSWPSTTDSNSFKTMQIASLVLNMSVNVKNYYSVRNGYRTLRPQDTSDPHETLQHHLKTLLRQKRATGHFGIRSTKNRDTLDPRQFRQDAAPPVIRLKVDAEVSCGRNVRLPPKWLVTVWGPGAVSDAGVLITKHSRLLLLFVTPAATFPATQDRCLQRVLPTFTVWWVQAAGQQCANSDNATEQITTDTVRTFMLRNAQVLMAKQSHSSRHQQQEIVTDARIMRLERSDFANIGSSGEGSQNKQALTKD